jgi:hypothetical protein
VDATGVDSGATCGDTPRLLVDYVQEDVPDAGRGAVEVPDIAVNATDLYYLVNWTSAIGDREGLLMRIPIGGGTGVRLASIPGGGSNGSQGLAVTATGAIFSEMQSGSGGVGEIVSIPATGGSGTVLATTKGEAHALVTDDQNVYFVDTEATKSVPLSGGAVRMVAAAVPFSLAVAQGTLYLADFTGNTVSSVPIGGGQVTVLAMNQLGAVYPVTCGPNICWANAGTMSQGSLMQLAPGGTPVMLAGGFSEPYDLIFDGNNFFLTAGGGAGPAHLICGKSC